jgi:hypothetical protein
MEAIGKRAAEFIYPEHKVAGTYVHEYNGSNESDVHKAVERLSKVVPASIGTSRLINKLAELGEKQPGQFLFYMNQVMAMTL